MEEEEQQHTKEEEKEEECVCVQESFQVSRAPHRCSPQDLQLALQLVNIQTMAFTPPHTLPWRVYLYTHAHCQTPLSGGTGADDHTTTHTHTLLLGELLYDGGPEEDMGPREGESQEPRLKVTMKQRPRDDEAMSGFLSVLSAVLHTFSSEGS